MNKEKRIKILLWTAVVLWMAVIFAFSSQNSDNSSETSDVVVDSVMENFFSDLDGMSSLDIEKLKHILTFLVRKSGHFIEYAILGILFTCAVSRQKLHLIKCAGISFAASALYGVTDEIHQLLVPGRACRIFDVCVDSAGSFAGVAAVTLILYLISKKHRKIISTRFF